MVRVLRTYGRAAICGALLLILVGCGSAVNKKSFTEPLEADLRAGNYPAAVAKIEAAKEDGKYGKKDRFLYFLDAGLAYHYASLFDSSNIRLSEAEQTADELYTKSVSKAILANTLANDNVLEYGGEDYEVLYSNLIMAINYLKLGLFDDAFVEVRRANDKLDLLEQKYVDMTERMSQEAREDTSATYVEVQAPEVHFNNSAFARYLSMHLYAADGLWDDARIDYDHMQDAFTYQPNVYPFDPPPVAYDTDSDSTGVLSVVGLVGLAPVKSPLNLRIRTDEQLHLLTIIYTDSTPDNSVFANYPLPKSVGDFYAKLSIPQLAPRASHIASVQIAADSNVIGELRLIEDVNTVARTTFQARQSLILWRTVLRTIGKTLTASAIKKKVDKGGLGGWLGKLATDIAYDISEQADLRGSIMLPGRIFVGDFEVPVGTYDLHADYLAADGTLIERRYLPMVTVRSGDFNLVRTFSFK